MLAHPALYCRFNFIQEGRELASQQPVRTKRDSKVFEEEESWRMCCFMLSPTPSK
jgi:hypothetical protein